MRFGEKKSYFVNVVSMCAEKNALETTGKKDWLKSGGQFIILKSTLSRLL